MLVEAWSRVLSFRKASPLDTWHALPTVAPFTWSFFLPHWVKSLPLRAQGVLVE